MTSKVILPDSLCDDELVNYIALRYSLTPTQVINLFLKQDGVICAPDNACNPTLHLEENEMAIFRDMGIKPTCIEFVDDYNLYS